MTIDRSTLETNSPRRRRQQSRSRTIASRVASVGQQKASAALLIVATIAAIFWMNLDTPGYVGFWETNLSVGVGDLRVDFTLHSLVNDALMAIFFFTVGLEVRREFAIGELTNRRRAIAPVVSAVAGLAVPAVVFLFIAAPAGFSHAWAVVISTDTAFLLAALALIGPRAPGRLRVFLLALAVVDDIGALTVIAVAYTEQFNPLALIIAVPALAGIYFTRYLPGGRGLAYGTLSIVVWMAFLASGVHPTLAGVVVALFVPVYRPSRRDVDHALELARLFRQSPNTKYARAAANGLRESISINERLQSAYGPYVAYAILPAFALANAGVLLSPEVVVASVRSPLTWGIILAFVIGKFIGVFGAALALRALRIGDFGPGLTLDRVAGGGALCGIGFTIALFLVDLAIDGQLLQNEARVGVLIASILSFCISAILFRISNALREGEDDGQTLMRRVDPARDHVIGPMTAPLEIVEYGDFQCEFCLKASGAIQEVCEAYGDRLRYVWRHAPLVDQHPSAIATAEAAEAAGLQGRFFDYQREIFANPTRQRPADLTRAASRIGLDMSRFARDVTSAALASRVRDDLLDAEAMAITSVPTFFINGRRYAGPYDARSLIAVLREAAGQVPPAASRMRSLSKSTSEVI